MNGIKKSISNNIKDPNPILKVNQNEDSLHSDNLLDFKAQSDKAAVSSKRLSNWSPSGISNTDYFDNEISTPVKGSEIKDSKDYSEEHNSRGINTAATDSKSCTNTSERKRLGKSAVRRKRKNINIRKINKPKPNRQKKSAKSLAKNLPNEWIHERIEEENDCEDIINNNNDLWDLDIDSVAAEPEKNLNVYNVASIRNNSMVNGSSTYNNRSSVGNLIVNKESRRVKSIRKPVSDIIIVQNSAYEGRQGTIFFQYPEYCGVVRPADSISKYSQSDFKKQGYSLSFKVTGSTHIYNSIVNSMKNAGFQMVEG